MKRFLKRVIFFLLPLLMIAVLIESFILTYPSTFNKKADFINKNKDIEVLILGSSHNEQAINPQYLSLKTASLANGGQDLRLDEALFFRYVEELSQLKAVIVEVDYHTLEFSQPRDYFKLPWYYRYHNIELGEIEPINKLLIYTSSPQFFNKLVKQNITSKGHKIKLNDWGFTIDGVRDEFKGLNYNEDTIVKLARKRTIKRHNKISIAYLNESKKRINRIINYCNNNDIQVILLSSPMYHTYLTIKRIEKENHRVEYIDSLLNVHKGLIYLGYENDPRFLVTDFRNEDHLNSKGAEKFSKIMDSILVRLLK